MYYQIHKIENIEIYYVLLFKVPIFHVLLKQNQ